MLADSSLQDMDDAMSDISIIDPEPESNSGSSDREALVETICRLAGVDDGTKRPLRVLVLGVHGVGKSSFINTIPAALNGEWHEFSYSGKPSGAQTVTVHLLRFPKCCLDNKDRFKTVLLPTLIDMPGLTDEADDKVEELLRLVLYGNIAEESAIGNIYEEIKNLNTEEIRKRYSTEYEDLKVDRVVFLASANEKFPERLMRCVLNAARPAHDMGLKRSIPVFGILTKKDKVVRSNPEFAEKEMCFKAGLGLTNHRYVICSNYCDETDELSGMKRGENPEINMPILNFLKDLCDPAVKVISSKEELSGMHKGKEDERNKDRHKQCIEYKCRFLELLDYLPLRLRDTVIERVASVHFSRRKLTTSAVLCVLGWLAVHLVFVQPMSDPRGSKLRETCDAQPGSYTHPSLRVICEVMAASMPLLEAVPAALIISLIIFILLWCPALNDNQEKTFEETAHTKGVNPDVARQCHSQTFRQSLFLSAKVGVLTWFVRYVMLVHPLGNGRAGMLQTACTKGRQYYHDQKLNEICDSSTSSPPMLEMTMMAIIGVLAVYCLMQRK